MDPKTDQHVMHRCDNRRCFNPKHLALGSAADNFWDMVTKGRSPVVGNAGERAPNAKLSDKSVREMRIRAAGGETITSLARAFNVSDHTAGFAIRGLTWKHVA
jgi:hypothetical protein